MHLWAVLCFNPRARAGRDGRDSDPGNMVDLFQSTRPRGARPWSPIVLVTRCDVSIHAPARGATARFKHRSSPNYRFNPRARAGRDPYSHPTQFGKFVSIHAPARGATSPI